MFSTHRIRAISAHEFVDADVVLVKLRSSVIPANNFLSSCGLEQNSDQESLMYAFQNQRQRSTNHKKWSEKKITVDFLEHAVHVFQIVMVKEPHWFVFVVFIEWHCKIETSLWCQLVCSLRACAFWTDTRFWQVYNATNVWSGPAWLLKMFSFWSKNISTTPCHCYFRGGNTRTERWSQWEQLLCVANEADTFESELEEARRIGPRKVLSYRPDATSRI